MNRYMQEAINEARSGISQNHGGPFGSVIVKDGAIVAKAHNTVVKDHDPTCHGEMMAIRAACAELNTFDLSGCTLYTTGEPCPMCLAACIWANIEKVYYGCTLADNAMIGFRDEKIDSLMGGRKNLDGYLENIDRDECLSLFEEYIHISEKTPY